MYIEDRNFVARVVISNYPGRGFRSYPGQADEEIAELPGSFRECASHLQSMPEVARLLLWKAISPLPISNMERLAKRALDFFLPYLSRQKAAVTQSMKGR
ncbi:hypothetical protein LRS08_07680 [Sphingomonas sp. J315]|nr:MULTISPECIES: hypothetical protein [unclassified Sphingomonas]MCR5870740.1 hypothetical protein [Sphingomonas sp. J344]UUY00927.1 hypothetical protein LRS08_07680 [Sphingomonas sp. J315]